MAEERDGPLKDIGVILFYALSLLAFLALLDILTIDTRDDLR